MNADSSSLPSPADGSDETGVLARELARAYRRMASWYHHELELSGPEADARARGHDWTPEEAAADLERIQSRPPDQVGWFDLERVMERDPDKVAELWRGIKAAARDELTSGHRAAQALDWDGRPWQRARFLAIRSSFREEHPPSGIEAALIDMAAEAYSAWLELSEQYQMLAGTEAELERGSLERTGRWTPPHQLMVEQTERVQRMAEAAHQRYLKTVKMLIEVRRSAQTVYVAHAGQVNFGQQQVNVTTSEPGRGDRRADLPKSSEH